ncbi:potassium/proton antiporter [Virgibacillus sp. NKC19-16]|uniref:potassium/proton antiporter n=1 Tax=Virgibacillus salidurans TaxID=2831673 RepID=UPI001F46862B|nr:potassium/proton antiporter [Virgibacillus sp. NKC19-16]UJL45478.1 potassium/proton antiporter [Virgibacillus sp. NKC19-16]
MLPELLDSNLFILIISIILIFSILGVQFTARVNAPSLIFFIALGMLFGTGGLDIVNFRDPEIAQLIGMMALVIILFDGGIKTNWGTIRPVAVPAISLATLGVVITSFILGVAAKMLFGLSWPESLLMGALVGSTDAAAVFAMLSGKNITNRLEATLEGESGANDPMAVFLTTTLISFVQLENSGFFRTIGQFFWQMGGGFLIGILIGKLASKALYKIKLDSSGLYPLLAFAFAFLAYSSASLLNASGLLAVYVAAILIGNSGLKQRNSILRFNEGFSWIAQIGMFFILGLFVVPSDLFTLTTVINGLILSIVLMFIARPIASFISVIGMKFNLKEKLFISWAGLRGAVPIVLAIFPMLAGLEHSQLYFNVIFFVVLTSTVLQGTTISLAARKLNLVKPGQSNPIQTMDLLSVGKKELEIVEYKIGRDTQLNGKRIQDIGFPKSTNIILIIRDGETISPHGRLIFQEEDELYVLTPDSERETLEELLKE